MATSIFKTEAGKKTILIVAPNQDTLAPDSIPPLKCILYIHYLRKFRKNRIQIQVVLDCSNEVNIMTLDYIAELDLKV